MKFGFQGIKSPFRRMQLPRVAEIVGFEALHVSREACEPQTMRRHERRVREHFRAKRYCSPNLGLLTLALDEWEMP